MTRLFLSAALAVLMLFASPVVQAETVRDDTVTLDLNLENSGIEAR